MMCAWALAHILVVYDLTSNQRSRNGFWMIYAELNIPNAFASSILVASVVCDHINQRRWEMCAREDANVKIMFVHYFPFPVLCKERAHYRNLPP